MNNFLALLSGALLVTSLLEAAPRNLPVTHMEKNMEPVMNKPQIARDLEGLDPREEGISKGLRGSFIVKHFISGPWKGGTAVIEVASDLSYAEIRIFDADSNLQRIYSVQPKSQKTHINSAHLQNPMKMVEQVNADDAENNAVEPSVARSPQRESDVQAQTAQAMQAERKSRTADDSEQAPPSSVGRRGTVSSRGGEIRESPSSENTPSAPPAVKAEEPKTVQATREVRKVIKVRRKRHRKRSQSALDIPLSGAPAPKEDEYYYEEVVVTKRVPVTPSRSETARAAEPVEKRPEAKPEPPPPPVTQVASSRRSKKETPPAPPARSEEPVEMHPPAMAGGVAVGAGSKSAGSAASSAAYDDANLPDVTDAVKENEAEDRSGKTGRRDKAVPVAEQRPAEPPAEKPSRRSRRAAKEAEDLAEAKKAAAKLESDKWTPPPAPKAQDAPPLTEELPARRTKEPVSPPEDIAEAKKAAAKLESDKWTPPAAPAPGDAGPEMVEETPRSRKPSAPVEDISAAQQAAKKLESDAWTPKPAPARPSDAELGLTNMPSTAKSRVNAKGEVDDLAPLSDQVKGAQYGSGGEAWSPKTSRPKLDAKEERTLAMLNNMKPVSDRPMKVNRDINNPEEGVKPFYSLEKYSGAQFGRHREFERRVMYKQNTRSPVRGYDFYIDEVDRKQEKHYLYYYKIDPKTKKAELIATEKHERVTFLGNYDIGSEDKGKIIKE